MKKIGKFLMLLGVGALVFSGCSKKADEKKDTGEKASDKLVIYTPNSEGLVAAAIPQFEEKYNIKVELIQAGTGELFKKLQSEKNAPVADVIWGGSYSQYDENKDLFQEYKPAESDQIEDQYQNDHSLYTSYTIDGSCLVINKDLIGDKKIEGYADLLDPELKGKISTADPANSSSAFCQLTNMLVAMGGYDSDEAWNYVKEVFTTIDGKISSSSSNVYKTVADGEMVVGLSYEDPTVKLLNDGANVDVVFMKEGSVFLPASTAIIKDCKNLENAKKFADYVISEEVQDRFGTTTTNRPVRKNAKTSENMKPLSEIKQLTEDKDYVIKHKQEIVDRYNEIFVDIQSGK